MLRVLGILGIISICFWNTIGNGFHFDDEHSLTGNPHIRDFSNTPTFFVDPELFSRNVGSAMYRPLVLLSYATEYAIAGLDGRIFHVTNIAIHAAVASLLYCLLLRFDVSAGVSVLAAITFGIHPLVGEPVNYVSSRSESLAALFVLSTVVLYLGTGFWMKSASLLCFAAALMSKSSAIVVLSILAVHEWRTAGTQSRILGKLWPFGALSVAYIAGTRLLIREAFWDAPVRGFHEQLYTQAKAIVFYFKLLALPFPQSVEHAFSESSHLMDPAVAVSTMLVVTVLILVWRGRTWGHGVPAFWMVWAAMAVLPTSIVPLNMLVNERRLYLALIGLTGIAVFLSRPLQRNVRFIVALSVVAFAVLTYQRNAVWADELTLWRDAGHRAPFSVRPQVRVGVLHRQNGRLDSSERHLRRALDIDPHHAPALNSLGNVARDRGDSKSAEALYREALIALPSYPDAMVNLAALLSSRGELAAAEQLYRQALSLSPNRVELFNNFGTTLLRRGRFDEARDTLMRAVDLNPHAAGVHFNLGGAYEALGQHSEAASAYERAIEIDSTYAKPYYNLGLLMLAIGEPERAHEALLGFLRHWVGPPKVAAFARDLLDRVAVVIQSSKEP